MLPTVLIGSIAIPTYPLFLLIAYWAGMWLAAKQAEKLNIDGDHIYNAGLFGLIAGIIGARLWFVLSHWDNYAPNLWQAFSLSRSALAPVEGLVIAGIVVLIYVQRNGVSLGPFVDAASYGLALAVAIGNVGAFLGGEALGAASNLPWAVEIAGVTRHPIQLYEAVTSLGILAVLFLIPSALWAGFKFWSFVFLYGAARLILEIFRARPQLIGDDFLAVQLLGLLAMLVALAIMAYNFSKDLKPNSERL